MVVQMLKLIISLLFITTSSFASETDQYMAWGQNIKDSLPTFNKIVNEKLQDVVQKASANRKCIDLADDFMGALENSPSLRKITKFEFQNSTSGYEVDIYPPESVSKRDFINASIHYKQENANRVKEPARTIKISAVLLGADKLTHFVTIGRNYHARYQKCITRGMSEIEAMTFTIDDGIINESGRLGLKWGTFSLADLEANFQGMMLARSLCEKDNPNLKKINGKWAIDHPINFAKFITPYLDESFNYNHFKMKKWVPAIAVIKNKYCDMRDNEEVISRLEYYSSFNESFSNKYVKNILEQKYLVEEKEFQEKISSIDLSSEDGIKIFNKLMYKRDYPRSWKNQSIDAICDLP